MYELEISSNFNTFYSTSLHFASNATQKLNWLKEKRAGVAHIAFEIKKDGCVVCARYGLWPFRPADSQLTRTDVEQPTPSARALLHLSHATMTDHASGQPSQILQQRSRPWPGMPWRCKKISYHVPICRGTVVIRLSAMLRREPC